MIARRSFVASPRPPRQLQRRASTPAQASRLGIVVTGRRRQPTAKLDTGAHPAACGAARCLQIPKGFCLTAQGWRTSAYLGSTSHNLYQPQRGCGECRRHPGLPAPKARLNASRIDPRANRFSDRRKPRRTISPGRANPFSLSSPKRRGGRGAESEAATCESRPSW